MGITIRVKKTVFPNRGIGQEIKWKELYIFYLVDI